MGGLWTLPPPWTPRTRPPPLGTRPKRVSHSAHRRHSSESGQITCQTEADSSLVNNRLFASLFASLFSSLRPRCAGLTALTEPSVSPVLGIYVMAGCLQARTHAARGEDPWEERAAHR